MFHRLEMDSQLSVPTALPEEQSLVPSAHIRKLTAACYLQLQRTWPLFCPPASSSHVAYTHTDIQLWGGEEEMTQQLRKHTAPAQGLSLAPSTYFKWLKTACNSSFKEIQCPLLASTGIHIHYNIQNRDPHTHTKINVKKCFKERNLSL